MFGVPTFHLLPFGLGAAKAWTSAPTVGWAHTDIWISSDRKPVSMPNKVMFDDISYVNH